MMDEWMDSFHNTGRKCTILFALARVPFYEAVSFVTLASSPQSSITPLHVQVCLHHPVGRLSVGGLARCGFIVLSFDLLSLICHETDNKCLCNRGRSVCPKPPIIPAHFRLIHPVQQEM